MQRQKWECLFRKLLNPLCFNLGMGAEYIYVTFLMTFIVSLINVSTNLNSKVDNQHICTSSFCIESHRKTIFFLISNEKKSQICLICCKSMLLCIVRKKLASKWTWCILQSFASAYVADNLMRNEAKYLSAYIYFPTDNTNSNVIS